MKKILAIIAAVALLSGGVLHAQKKRHDDAELQWQYTVYNEFYFNDALPHDIQIVWANIPPDPDGTLVLGDTLELSAEEHTFRIRIDTKTNVAPVTRNLTLIHEMCHVKTYDYVREHSEDDHGARFQACMMNLARQDAFHNLW